MRSEGAPASARAPLLYEKRSLAPALSRIVSQLNKGPVRHMWAAANVQDKKNPSVAPFYIPILQLL